LVLVSSKTAVFRLRYGIRTERRNSGVFFYKCYDNEFYSFLWHKVTPMERIIVSVLVVCEVIMR
jgi:hypothetical protein